MMNTNTDPQAHEGSGLLDDDGEDPNRDEARQLENMLAEQQEDDEAHQMPSSHKKRQNLDGISDEYNSR